MNRLRDEWGDDPVAIRGIEILRGTPPTPRMLEMKRRVWLAQQQRGARPSGGLHLSRLRVGVVIGGAILCVAGTSGAVIAAKRWIVPALREASGVVPARSPARTDRAQSTRSRPATMAEVTRAEESRVPGKEPGRVETPGATTAPAPAVMERAVAPSRSSRVSHPAPARRITMPAGAIPASASGRVGPAEAPQPPISIAVARTTPTTSPAAARERTQVLDAMIALRRDHDPVSAGAMLQHYLTSHPSGTLREEALVLAIEAANARGDLALARSLARAYQDAYPNGRFRRYAQDRAR